MDRPSPMRLSTAPALWKGTTSALRSLSAGSVSPEFRSPGNQRTSSSQCQPQMRITTLALLKPTAPTLPRLSPPRTTRLGLAMAGHSGSIGSQIHRKRPRCNQPKSPTTPPSCHSHRQWAPSSPPKRGPQSLRSSCPLRQRQPCPPRRISLSLSRRLLRLRPHTQTLQSSHQSFL